MEISAHSNKVEKKVFLGSLISHPLHIVIGYDDIFDTYRGWRYLYYI